MQQVADRAQVSIATVSFVVNDTKPVTPQTRERILRAIDELGYRRNAMARALASRKSRIIALIYPLLDQRNHHGFIDAAATVAAERGYSLVLWPIHSGDANSEIASLIQAGIADGVLLMEVQLEDARVAYLQKAKAPFALIGRTRELAGIDYADIDFERTVRVAVDDLAALGHRDFTLVIEDLSDTPLADYSPPIRTVQTFAEVMSERHLEGHVFRVPPRPGALMSLADDLMREAPATTAVLSMSGDACVALLSGLHRRGVRVPQDISIVGLATASTVAALLDPALTTYDAPGDTLGEIAANALIDRLEGRNGPPTQICVACTLHEGESVGPAPDGRAPLDEIGT
jgi:DNA-binding LacI/PurR family transcriptional regulator